MRIRALFAALAVVIGGASPALAQPELETVLEGLYNPCGVAIQPETGHVFVADSGGLRVIRVVDGQAQDVIVGFPKDVYGKGPMYDIGPLGLLFLDKDTLIVGGGGLPDGQEMLRVYTIPDAGQPPLQADQMEASFRLEPTDTGPGEGNFYALAANDSGVFVTSNGDDTKGWVARAQREGDKLVSYERYLATKEAVNVDAPVGVALSSEGHLVVGQMGEINVPQDSLLTFYNPNTKKLLLSLETGLFDIAALAYSPKGQLFALDYAWMAAEEGGLFQLIKEDANGEQAVRAHKIVALDKPTAMVFAPDGSLYITVIGTSEEGSETKGGKLLKIGPGL